MLKYEKKLITTAKVLRKNATPWEQKLWYEFLRKYPVRFQRGKPIDKYIVDFYCAQAKLVVELDGGSHYTSEQIMHDSKRTEILKSYGLTVIRLCNTDVVNKFYETCTVIDETVKSSLPQSPSY